MRNRTRIATVRLAGRRLYHIAKQHERRLRRKRIDERRFSIRHQNHVRFIDRFPTGDGGTIKHDTLFKAGGIHLISYIAGMLPFPLRIGKAKIDKLNVVVFDHF